MRAGKRFDKTWESQTAWNKIYRKYPQHAKFTKIQSTRKVSENFTKIQETFQDFVEKLQLISKK